MLEQIYLITNLGIQQLAGDDANEVREQIIQAEDNLLAYRFYDDDRRAWAYWGVRDVNDTIKPLAFPNQDEYGMTSAELFSLTVTYPSVLARVIEIITRKEPSLWERMMKPATVISAIVLIVFVMMIMVVALQG